MATKFIQTKSMEVSGKEFVQGNVPEVHAGKCSGCALCVTTCRKLGPDVLEMRKGRVFVARPKDCLGDGACMVICPTKAIVRLSRNQHLF